MLKQLRLNAEKEQESIFVFLQPPNDKGLKLYYINRDKDKRADKRPGLVGTCCMRLGVMPGSSFCHHD